MRPVPFIPAFHSIVRKECDQLHAAETAFLTVPVVKVGQSVIFDAEKNVYIPDIMLSKDCTPCAVIPLGYFEDDTIHAIVEMISL